MEAPALPVPLPTHVLLCIHPCTTQEQPCTNACSAVRYLLLYTSSAVCVLGERGAWRGVERQKPPYRPRSSIVRYTLPCQPRFFCCTLAVLLSYAHFGFVGCRVFFFCCVMLCCTTAVLRTAVGWLNGSVRGYVHGFVFFFLGYH